MNGIERTAAPADTTQWRRVGGAGEQQPMSACPNAIASVGVALYGDLGTQGMVEALFHAALVSDGMRYVRTDSWRTDVTAPTIAGAEELFVSRGVNWHRSVLRLGRSLLHVVIGQGCVTVRAAHEAEGEATVALAAARSAFPESEPAEDQTVPMWLWSAGANLVSASAVDRYRRRGGPKSRRTMRSRPGRHSIGVEEAGQLFGHCAGELVDIGDRHGAFVVARHVMADADGDQFDHARAFPPWRSRRAGASRGSSPG